MEPGTSWPAATLPRSVRPDGRLRLVIFDCDGVLIDSEGPSCRVVARELRQIGVELDDEAAVERLAGRALTRIKTEMEAETGRVLPDDWAAVVQQKLVELMQREARVIDGAHGMLTAVIGLDLPVRVGSNSSIAEMDVKFARTGLDRFVADRIHSARDMGKPKPDPAVYLHAAEIEGVAPDECIVLEDTDTGASAARAAGMACVLLRPLDLPAPDWPGLFRIAHLSEFAPLLERILAAQASGGTRS
ncbi:HAD-superfamily hydrolase, subfamily IA, variant 3 [Gluconacetobacter diazotrophicus PA1 5]|uniref:HAD family phosphatase n=2 Tax=Gluconacetobacter diazotrophicus TaxID=33996 RepID=A0A7W4FCN5_GLUDI|nr:HAD family phosphatase [Gluconacetobacter diazotrophicus]ACI51686.1 HAD-superfamily hydrolase, subfamily IA, variant 3 [Gluconacetobacter diazotrophicus PA1 5]MBB2155274.1 HAD family phosphatase [Gluconacetobacter diazotrophicus]TWB11030.1 HAD superfamily hydrolase (TIGR01509 family) [Gluconacetobacter diazotrophicus]CAP55157.1 putative hydrolase protein [Gluconacetobacter diazotrophicus PA1 5]